MEFGDGWDIGLELPVTVSPLIHQGYKFPIKLCVHHHYYVDMFSEWLYHSNASGVTRVALLSIAIHAKISVFAHIIN